jgi:NAD(P) transhydrogenase
MVLYTAGRVGATEALNLESCGLTADDRGRPQVDPQTFQTTAPHIYCARDAIGFPSLASTSMEQGRIAACHAFGVPRRTRLSSSLTASFRCRRSPRWK